MGRLVARERELEAITAFLEPGADDGRALLLEGDAGIGKSALLRAARSAAAAAGYRVLYSASAESEAQLAFAAVADLIDDVFDDVADALPEPQRRALAIALLREAPPDRPVDPRATAAAFLRTLRAVAAESPVLVAVDDVQWLDSASAAVLRYPLRRLERARVTFLFARRRDQADLLELDRIDEGRLHLLDVGPLTVGALGRILNERLGVSYPRPTMRRIVEASGGNPLFALELARALHGAASPAAGDAPLPVTGTLRELVASRVAALPDPTVEVLVFAAALSRPVLDVIAAAARVDASALLAPAVEANVVELDGEAVRFAHPLFAAAVYDLAGAGRRREVHERLAAVVDESEERARHLALGTAVPDDAVAAALEAAARSTRTRGARADAAGLFEAAARLTPEDDVEQRVRRRLAGAGAVFEAGDTERARELLERLVDELGDRPEAAEARWRLGTVLAETGEREPGMRLWAEALAAAADPSLASSVHRSMAVALIYAGEGDAAVEHAEGSVAAAGRADDAEALAFALSTRALAAAVTGDPAYRSLVAEALELEASLDIPSSAWSPSAVAGECAFLALDLDDADRRCSAVLDQAVEAGNVEMELWGVHRLATTRLAAGDVASAAELAELTVDLAETTGVMRFPAARLSAEVAAFAGRADEARATLERVVAEAELGGWKRHVWLARSALGALELSCGDADAAATVLLGAREVTGGNGMQHATAALTLADEAESAAAAGRAAQAHDALAALRALAAQPAWAEPLLLRAEAAVLSLGGDLAGAESLLERARDTPQPLPLQRARTLLALGVVQRRLRKRRAARQTLDAARTAFAELGAASWADRAGDELSRIGGRAPSADELTPSERRIAELVADGKTNREVATLLTVAPHTVESTLTQIYRKLDVRSRTELALKLVRR